MIVRVMPQKRGELDEVEGSKTAKIPEMGLLQISEQASRPLTPGTVALYEVISRLRGMTN